jgi:hypothetical protein
VSFLPVAAIPSTVPAGMSGGAETGGSVNWAFIPPMLIMRVTSEGETWASLIALPIALPARVYLPAGLVIAA